MNPGINKQDVGVALGSASILNGEKAEKTDGESSEDEEMIEFLRLEALK